MLIVGLTGGIASGKSTVAAHFAALGIPIIDTDLIARELVQPGQEALNDVVAHFGAQALQEDGQLNRAWLRQRIFSSAQERATLNAIMHPRIYAQVVKRLAALKPEDASYAIIVIPLLIENQNYDKLPDLVLVVDLTESEQLKRLMQRDGVNQAQAEAILNAQATRAQRLQRADDIIDNNGCIEALATRIAQLHHAFLQLASAR